MRRQPIVEPRAAARATQSSAPMPDEGPGGVDGVE